MEFSYGQWHDGILGKAHEPQRYSQAMAVIGMDVGGCVQVVDREC